MKCPVRRRQTDNPPLPRSDASGRVGCQVRRDRLGRSSSVESDAGLTLACARGSRREVSAPPRRPRLVRSRRATGRHSGARIWAKASAGSATPSASPVPQDAGRTSFLRLARSRFLVDHRAEFCSDARPGLADLALVREPVGGRRARSMPWPCRGAWRHIGEVPLVDAALLVMIRRHSAGGASRRSEDLISRRALRLIAVGDPAIIRSLYVQALGTVLM
jgi:hypothetical protein